MSSTLIIGYGNPSRRDDGVGMEVVNGIRRRLGQSALEETLEGFDDLGRPLDTLFLQQMTPELAETLAGYDRVIFVDAHVGIFPELVRWSVVEPTSDPALVSHHMKPGNLLLLAETLYGRAPAAELLSIRGFDFDFGAFLSPQTAEGARMAIDQLWAAVHAGPE